MTEPDKPDNEPTSDKRRSLQEKLDEVALQAPDQLPAIELVIDQILHDRSKTP